MTPKFDLAKQIFGRKPKTPFCLHRLPPTHTTHTLKWRLPVSPVSAGLGRPAPLVGLGAPVPSPSAPHTDDDGNVTASIAADKIQRQTGRELGREQESL